MKVQTLVRVSEIVLLAAAVSIALLFLIYALQHPQQMLNLATVSWNG